MEEISDYSIYLSQIERGETRHVFRGELSLLKIVAACEHNLPNGQFYVWDDLDKEGHTILLKAKFDGESVCVTDGRLIEESLMDIADSIQVETNHLDSTIRWWNLCYHRENQGLIKYDPYYDNFYAANMTEKKMSELKEAIAQWIENSFVGVDGLIYVLGDLANCNPIIYQLQQRGLDVKTLPIDDLESVSDDNERLLQLRDRLALPYCDSNQINMSFIASDGIDNCLAECHRSYLITIPIDLISINDNAVGSFSYKDIFPSEEFCRDYSCCGHDYSYVEMELFADLHGNTVLKTTNSKAESKYTIINKFKYTNLQKDGQSQSI